MYFGIDKHQPERVNIMSADYEVVWSVIVYYIHFGASERIDAQTLISDTLKADRSGRSDHYVRRVFFVVAYTAQHTPNISIASRFSVSSPIPRPIYIYGTEYILNCVWCFGCSECIRHLHKMLIKTYKSLFGSSLVGWAMKRSYNVCVSVYDIHI